MKKVYMLIKIKDLYFLNSNTQKFTINFTCPSTILMSLISGGVSLTMPE